MTSTANFTGRSSSKTPRAASRSPRKAPRWQTSIRSASWRPYAATALRCATTAGKSSWERHPATAARGAFRAKSWRGTSAPNRRRRDTLRTAPYVRRRLGPAHRHTRPFRRRAFRRRRENLVRHRPGDGRAVATEREIVDTRGRTFTVRTAATCVYAKEPLPQGTGSLYGIIDYFAGKYTLRVTNREAEFSGTAAHSAATRPTAGRPARTTRTTQTTRTTRTMRAGVTAATPPTAYP